jgi:rod shape-determining protein MreD
MTYFLYIARALSLMICQTTIVPRLPAVTYCFDFLLPWVIYLAAFRPVHETLPFVLFTGALMDSLSGGPFGLFLTSYLWTFIAVRLTTSVIRAENPLLLVCIIIAAVVGQNALFFAVLGTGDDDSSAVTGVVRVISEQIGWVLLIGPGFALAMRRTYRLSSRRRTRTVVKLQPRAEA